MIGRDTQISRHESCEAPAEQAWRSPAERTRRSIRPRTRRGARADADGSTRQPSAARSLADQTVPTAGAAPAASAANIITATANSEGRDVEPREFHIRNERAGGGNGQRHQKIRDDDADGGSENRQAGALCQRLTDESRARGPERRPDRDFPRHGSHCARAAGSPG